MKHQGRFVFFVAISATALFCTGLARANSTGHRVTQQQLAGALQSNHRDLIEGDCRSQNGPTSHAENLNYEVHTDNSLKVTFTCSTPRAAQNTVGAQPGYGGQTPPMNSAANAAVPQRAPSAGPQNVPSGTNPYQSQQQVPGQYRR